MTIEMSSAEAELLIVVLIGAEGAFAIVQPELVRALEDLRPWRSALLRAYLTTKIEPDPDLQPEWPSLKDA